MEKKRILNQIGVIFVSCLLMLMFCYGEALAVFSLPSSRSVTWQGNVGVKYGIPTNRTQCGSTITSTGNTTNRTATIQNAINACGSGQYVLLGPGQFTVSALYMRSNVTLRGSGMGVTIINPSSSEFLQFGGYGIAFGTSIGISSGLSKGSTSITTSGNHGWSAGDHIVIDQLNNPNGDPPITNVGDGGSSMQGGRTGTGSRVLQQVVKLIAPTSGTTATLEIPLYATFNGSTPQGTKVTMAVENAGVESMTFNGSYIYSMTIFNASNCWLYNVELNGMHESGFGVYLSNSYRITISHSKFHQSTGGRTSDNYLITTAGTGSAYLIENNVLYNATNPITFQGGASGCVVAYNYITNVNQTAYPTANRYGIGLHGSHQFQNLFEGNVIEGAFFASDNYWGSNSHNTVFRNRIVMDYNKDDMQITLGIDVHQTYYNIIGNYLGGSETGYEVRGMPYDVSPEYVYLTGAGASYGAERTTMLRHGNWDGHIDTQRWCDTSGEPGCQGGSNDHTLPESLYLSEKPLWFGTVEWPAVNPASTKSPADIPAKIFYDTEAWPKEGTSPSPAPPNNYALTVGKEGTGTVSSSPAGINCGADCTESYVAGTLVTLTATPPNQNTSFVWSDTCTVTGTYTCTVTMDAAKTVTATFTSTPQPIPPSSYALTIVKNVSGSGTISSSPAGINCGSGCTEASANYAVGTQVVLSATPNSGYTFAGWSGGVCSGTVPCTVTMDAAKSVTAQFAVVTSNLSVEKTGTGTGNVTGGDGLINCGSTCSVIYEYGTPVTLTAAAYSGSDFAGWSGACTGTGNCLVSMTAARTVTATFTLTPPPSNYALTIVKNGTGSGSVSSNPSGINCGATCSTNFASGASVGLTPTPVSGSTFAGWSGACTGTGACIVAMTAARSVTATFTLTPPPSNYALTIVKDGNGNGTVSSNPSGIDCGATCSTNFTDGTSVQLTVTPVSGSTFAGWSGACAGTGTSCIVSMTAARSVTARFTLIPPPSNYALTVVKGGTGSGTIISTPVGIDCGATCSANFASGTSVQLTATPVTDNTFAGWSGDCTGTGICRVTMNSTKTVSATFVKPNALVLLIKKIGRGLGRIKSTNLYASVSPELATTDIDCGDVCIKEYDVETTVTLNAEPEPGNSFAGWSGACSGTGACTVNVSQLTSVEANFIPNEAVSENPPAPVSGDAGGGGGGGGCFIATAAYGSYLDPHVMVLREFRDKVLLKNKFGRMFVAFYYKNSPAIADRISRIESLRLLTRLALTPMVYAMAYPITAAMILLTGLLILAIAVRRKKLAKLTSPAVEEYFRNEPRRGVVRVR